MLNKNLDDLEKIQQAKLSRITADMLKLATKNRKELKNLPSDLRERADEILYNKQ